VDYALEKIQEQAEPTLSGIANQYLKKGGWACTVLLYVCLLSCWPYLR
jgi:hypothetical protein